MAEKEELIQLINKLRAEIELEPYDELSLQEMSEEELERLYQRQLALKENEVVEKPRLNPKILVVAGVFLVIALAAGFVIVKKISSGQPQVTTTVVSGFVQNETTTVLGHLGQPQ